MVKFYTSKLSRIRSDQIKNAWEVMYLVINLKPRKNMETRKIIQTIAIISIVTHLALSLTSFYVCFYIKNYNFNYAVFTLAIIFRFKIVFATHLVFSYFIYTILDENFFFVLLIVVCPFALFPLFLLADSSISSESHMIYLTYFVISLKVFERSLNISKKKYPGLKKAKFCYIIMDLLVFYYLRSSLFVDF